MMKRKNKKARQLCSLLLSLALIITMLPVSGLHVYAGEEGVQGMSLSGSGTKENPYVITADDLPLEGTVAEKSTVYYTMQCEKDCSVFVNLKLDAVDTVCNITINDVQTGKCASGSVTGIEAKKGSTVLLELENKEEEAEPFTIETQSPYAAQNYKEPVLVTVDNYEDLGFSKDYIGYYAVYNRSQLDEIRTMVRNVNNGINVLLGGDILYNKEVLDEDGNLNTSNVSRFAPWAPIGHATAGSGTAYRGNFDGCGHTISGLYYNHYISSMDKMVGLIGRLENGSVSNVRLVDSYFESNENSGGIVAVASKARVFNCYSAATIKTTVNTSHASTGGIVGCVMYSEGMVTNCWNAGKIDSVNSNVGGIAGAVDNGASVSNCYNTGSVSGNEICCGIAGEIWKGGSVSNCYNTGKITGNNNSDAVAYIMSGSYGTVTNCYYLEGDKSSNYASSLTESDFKSGKAAYLLNGENNMGVFRQDVSEEGSYPGFTGSGLCYDRSTDTYYNHDHSCVWEKGEDDATIVYRCKAEHCPDTKVGSIVIKAPADLAANGELKEATIQAEGLDTAPDVGEITYSTEDGKAPTKSGEYTASMTFEGITASVTYTVEQYAASLIDSNGKLIDYYKSMDDVAAAAAQAKESTIKLLDDASMGVWSMEEENNKTTLDLNGKCLIVSQINLLDGEFTIIDSDEGGKLEGTGSKIINVTGGIFNLKSGTLTYIGESYYTHILYLTGGTTNISGGKLDGAQHTNPIYMANAYTEVSIVDGTLIGYQDISQIDGKLHISGGSFQAKNKIAFIRNGTLNVSGGTFKLIISDDSDLDECFDFYIEVGRLVLTGGTFENMLKVSRELNSVLADDAYYRDANGNMITFQNDETEAKNTVKVSQGANLQTEAEVTLSNESYMYSGQACEPAVTVTVGGRTLIKDTDYTVSYADNRNAGAAKAVIEGVEKYTGRKEVEYGIDAKQVKLTWNADRFYYTGTTPFITATYEDVSGNAVTASNTVKDNPVTPGQYLVNAVIEDGNYALSDSTKSHTYTIEYLPVTAAACIISGENYYDRDKNVYWFCSGASVTVQPVSGYTIAASQDGVYAASVTFKEADKKSVYLKNEKGEMTGEISLEAYIGYDKTAPSVTATADKNTSWLFGNQFGAGRFYNEKQTVELAYEDDGCGVAYKQYYISDKRLTAEQLQEVSWKNYEGPLELQEKGLYVLYAHTADLLGNEVICNSDGIVIYENSTQNVEAEYTRTTNTDVTAQISFNGNTVREVTYDGKALTKQEDYVVTGDGICLKAKFLNTLPASADPYKLKVSYSMYGMLWNADSAGTSPDTVISVKIQRAPGSVSNISDVSKVYDGESVSEASYSAVSRGEAVYEYKEKDADDSTFTREVPKNAGSYVVRVTVRADEDYEEAMGTASFTISKADKAAPEGLKATANGVISGVNNTMEYRKEGEAAYTAIEGTKLTNLAEGTYYIRYKETTNYYASPDTELVVSKEKGDVTGDGTIDLQDAMLALKAALKVITLDEQAAQAADVDGQEGISLTDVQIILKYALKIDEAVS